MTFQLRSTRRRQFDPTVRPDAGIARPEVDRAVVAFDLLDEGDDRSLVGDIDAHADATDLLCDCGGAAPSRSATYTIDAVGGKRRAMARPIPLAAPVTTTTAP